MNESGHAVIVIGGVMLLAWCGLGRLARRPAAVHPGTDEYQLRSHTAVEAEFRPLDDAPGGTVCCVACGTPWAAGTLFCDCGEETEEDDDPLERPTTETTISAAVCVHTAESLWKANLLRCVLESHAIPCQIQAGELVSLYRHGAHALFVGEGDVDGARLILARIDDEFRAIHE